MAKRKGGYPAYLKEEINKNVFLLEAGQGKHSNGNVFALLRCLETNPKWKKVKPYLTVLKENQKEINEKLKQQGFTKTKTLVRNSEGYKRILATAGYLVTDNSFPTYMVKREGQIYLNTWHGTPLKQLGRADIANSSSIGNVQKNFLAADYLLFPNAYTRDIMMKDYMMEKVYRGKTLLCDYPRNDALFDKEKRLDVRKNHGIEDKHVFAYMPTWRGTGRNADADSQIQEAKETILQIEKNLGEEEVLYVNFHFLIGDRLDYSQFNKARPFPAELETYDFLCACDTLISDYSSVMMDFAQAGRNVIMYMYDYDEYFQQKGFYFDICSLPFYKAFDSEELGNAIGKALSKESNYQLDDEFADPHAGYGAEKVLGLLLEGKKDDLEIQDYSERSDSLLLYVGDLNNKANCRLVEKHLGALPEDAKAKTVIAFENEIEGSSVDFLKNLDGRIDFLRMPGKGNMSRKERIALLLNRSCGLMSATADAYYKREHDRLFGQVNCREISLFNTDMFYRIRTVSAGNVPCTVHRIPMEFYNRPNEVFYSHPSTLKRTFESFDEVIPHDSGYGMEIWKENSCEGIHAYLRKVKLLAKGSELILSGEVDIRMQEDAADIGDLLMVSSKVYGNVLNYPINWNKKKRKASGGICRIRASFSASLTAEEFQKWYSSNMLSVSMRKAGNQITVPLMSDRRRLTLKKKVHGIHDSGMVCELKEDFRLVRIMIRKANVSDATVEKLKLAFAYVLSRISFGKRPIVLFEKNCSRYEESASVVFEKLIDSGRKNVKFILDDGYEHLDMIRPEYRKHLVSRFSLSHYYYMFAAASLISSESLDHALEKKCANRLFKKHVLKGKKNYAFLQHGVMYMVSLASEQRAFFRKSENGGKQRVVVSSRLEADHFMDNTNYGEKDVYVCGLPKFDRSKKNDDADRIVIMTTWRPWEYVNGQGSINGTGYYSLLKMIVESIPEDLSDRIIVLPHPLIQQQIEERLNEDPQDLVWKYYTPGVKYDDVLKECKLLITDYSSIAYDAFYRGSAVVFCWRDKDSCMNEYGRNARLMLTEELAFGDICMTEGEIAASVANSYYNEIDENYVRNYRKIVEFSDGKNADRFIAMAKADGIL